MVTFNVVCFVCPSSSNSSSSPTFLPSISAYSVPTGAGDAAFDNPSDCHSSYLLVPQVCQDQSLLLPLMLPANMQEERSQESQRPAALKGSVFLEVCIA